MSNRTARLFAVGLILLATTLAACSRATAQANVEGQWGSVVSWPIEAIHASLLPTGKMLVWQSWRDSPALWDPATGQFSDAATPAVNIFCSGHTWLPDGRLLVVGGHIANAVGEAVADIYDPWTNSWAGNVPNMNAGRWYPSATTLGDGNVLVLSGDLDGTYGDTNPLPQIYDVDTNSWIDLNGAIRAQDNLLPEYPRVFQAPDGRVVSLTDNQDDTEWLDVTGSGSWEWIDKTLDGNLANYGPAVMYDAGKIAYMGGGWATTDNISMLDLNDSSPEWRYGAEKMRERRRQNDATILADGTVLITGGTSCRGWNEGVCPDQNGEVADGEAGAVHYVEIWDPETEQITQAATPSDIYRGYHSTATLLPDGRVLVTGGDHDDDGYTSNKNAEIFEPAYLHQGYRPTIDAAPDTVSYGETFFVETADAATIERAMMIIPGNTTHAQNWSQRANRLEVTQVAGGVEITLTTNSNEAPPGNYMLFLVDDNGVPTEAAWVQATFGLPGDFNGDGQVDAADYTVWRDHLGTGYSLEDYQLYVDNFGATLASATSDEATTVPEPFSCWALAAVVGSLLLSRRR